MKINWFSPLPPSKTGIAEYSVHVLEALAKRAEIIIWTDQHEWSPEIARFGQIRRYERNPDWRELNRADATFYNIGNNADYHASLWMLSRQHAGIVILHDTHLQHLFIELFKHRTKKIGIYRDCMARYYGDAGRTAANQFLNGCISASELATCFPLTELGLENSLGAVVHSTTAADQVANASRRPVAYAPLPFSAACAPEPAVSDGGRLHGPPYRLIVFGYLGPNRRLKAILQSLQTFPEREKFRLHVYGQLHDETNWRTRLGTQDLNSLVTLHGHVSDEELDDALAQSDLAINLRYPTMGEASWTQLRLWSHGLPSLVTQTGWYATLPPEAVAFVRPEHEINDIQGHLLDFIRHPVNFVRKGTAGWRTLRDFHAPERYVDTLLQVAVEAEAFRGRGNALKLVGRTGEILSQFTSHEEHLPMLSRVAREIRRVAS